MPKRQMIEEERKGNQHSQIEEVKLPSFAAGLISSGKISVAQSCQQAGYSPINFKRPIKDLNNRVMRRAESSPETGSKMNNQLAIGAKILPYLKH